MKNGYNVLFVDNDQSFLSAFRRLFLNEPEIEVFTAQDSKEALESLSRDKIDLVVADQQLPKMAGAEFLNLAEENYPDVLRMLLVAAAEVGAAVRLVNNGELYRFLGGHSKRVAELSRMTAEKLVDSQDEVEMVYFAALLHDIGFFFAAQ